MKSIAKRLICSCRKFLIVENQIPAPRLYDMLDDEIFLWLEGPQDILAAQILGALK